MRPSFSLIVVLVVASLPVIPAADNGEYVPLVVVYPGEMEEMAGWGQGILDLLSNSSSGGEHFLLATDSGMLASLLALPNVRCVIIASMNGKDVASVADALLSYYNAGGSAIGIQSCCSVAAVGELARTMFPVFGNTSGKFVIKNGRWVNEYIRDQGLPAFDDLPDSFDLPGQFFLYPGDSSRKLVEQKTLEGETTVLFREKKTQAPLVIAHTGPKGGRTVSLPGCMVIHVERVSNYYGNMLGHPLFRKLLVDSFRWVSESNTRFEKYEQTFAADLQERKEQRSQLLDEVERGRRMKKTKRLLFLAVSWGIGLSVISCVVYFRFLKPHRRYSQS